mgnify:CR=1 FL=1
MLSRFNDKWIPHPRTGCWIWIGALQGGGYGAFSVGRKPRPAHRISYELYIAPISTGLNVLHKCDVRACVNPDHLFPGTQKDNILDAMAKGRMPQFYEHKIRPTCPRGHAFDEPNTYLDRTGTRHCRRCGADNARRYRSKEKA